MTRIKLTSLEFYSKPLRKLKNFKIDFADRFTVIAGHNGIGKSTILGLIASSSGLEKEKKITSLFEHPFSYDLHRIIHFDPDELKRGELGTPWPKAVYIYNETEEHWKTIRLTTRQEPRLRSVPSRHADTPNPEFSKQDGKCALPTIFLGLLRVLPIGEISENQIDSQSRQSLEEADKAFITNFIKSVIYSPDIQSGEFTDISIKNTKKRTSHPPYGHDCKSVSLGQDSLSSIAVAVASFNKLKRDLGNEYPGGLLVIDEIDVGFHPHAQEKLLKALCNSAKKLDLQIIATTHSPTIVELLHPDTKKLPDTAKEVDKIVYLQPSSEPKPADWSLDKILADMKLSDLPPKTPNAQNKRLKIYFEDQEAVEFFKGVFGMKRNTKKIGTHNVRIFPLGLGCEQIKKLPGFDRYFKSVIFLFDADVEGSLPGKNCLALPCPQNFEGRKNPEGILHSYIRRLVDSTDNYPDTSVRLTAQGISTDRLQEEFLNDYQSGRRDPEKRWFKQGLEKFHEYGLFTSWAKDHPQEMQAFKNALEGALKSIST